MNKQILYLLTLFLITGCQLPVIVQRIPFPVSEYNKLKKEGTAVVKGQVFMKTRGGDVKVGAGNEVFLNPVTSYSRQWYKEAYSQRNNLSIKDPRYDAYMIETIVDAQGNFELTNVPPGEYFLVGSVFWEVPNSIMQGGYIAKLIEVQNGKTYKIILTR